MKSKWLLLSFVAALMGSMILSDAVDADPRFISANLIRALYENTYPWLQEGTLAQQLLVEAEYGNLKLYGFGPADWDEFGPLDKAAFFLVTLKGGANEIKDICADISRMYTSYRVKGIQLPGLGDAIQLTGFYFTHHVLPTVYIISPEGVMLAVQGDSISIEASDVGCMPEDSFFRIVVISGTKTQANDGVPPWDFAIGVIHPDGEEFWSSVDHFQASPYERLVYVWHETKKQFELIERTPVNHCAVAEALLECVQKQEWDNALAWFSPAYLDRYRIKSANDLRTEVEQKISSSGVESFLGFPAPHTLRLKGKTGAVVDLHYDRDWCSAYRTSRRVFAGGKETDVWVAPPLIDDISVVQFLNAGQALDKLLATPSVNATFERFKGLSTPLGVLFENKDINGFGDDDVTELAYYQARVYESHETHIVTLGHYRVMKDTGEVYSLDILTGEYVLESQLGEPDSL